MKTVERRTMLLAWHFAQGILREEPRHGVNSGTELAESLRTENFFYGVKTVKCTFYDNPAFYNGNFRARTKIEYPITMPSWFTKETILNTVYWNNIPYNHVFCVHHLNGILRQDISMNINGVFTGFYN